MEQEYITLISNLGFPVAMCVLMWRYITDLNKRHEHEVNALKDTLNENTKVLTELTTLIKILVNEKK